MNAIDWLSANWGLILVVLAIVLFLFGKQIINKFRKKKPEDVPSEQSAELFKPEVTLFEDTDNTISTLQEQKMLAEKWIRYIQAQGKILTKDEEKHNLEYRRNRASFTERKRTLGMQYTTYSNQLNMINTMIENQAQMDASLKKMKGG